LLISLIYFCQNYYFISQILALLWLKVFLFTLSEENSPLKVAKIFLFFFQFYFDWFFFLYNACKTFIIYHLTQKEKLFLSCQDCRGSMVISSLLSRHYFKIFPRMHGNSQRIILSIQWQSLFKCFRNDWHLRLKMLQKNQTLIQN